jgi:Zn-dependent metalloprotease
MNEGLSDIWVLVLNLLRQPTKATWLIGEDIEKNWTSSLRSMMINAEGQPIRTGKYLLVCWNCRFR